MQVYIEYAFLQNFIIDGILLSITRYEWQMPVKPLQILGAAVCGAAFAIVYPVLNLPMVFRYLFKLCGGILLGLLGSGKKGWLKFSATLLANTFLWGGMVYAAYGILGQAPPTTEGEVPLGTIVACGLALIVGTEVLIKRLAKRHRIGRCLYRCELKLHENVVKAVGFLDTGNGVEYHGRPVHILSRRKALALWGEYLFSGHTKKDSVFLRTVSGIREIPVFEIDSLKIYCEGNTNIIEQAMIGLAPEGLGGQYDLILHPEGLIGGWNDVSATVEILPQEMESK